MCKKSSPSLCPSRSSGSNDGLAFSCMCWFCGLSVADRCQFWLEITEVCANLGGYNGGNMVPAVTRNESQSYGPRPNRLSRSMAKVSGRFMYITAGAHLNIALYLYSSVNQSHIYQSTTSDPLYHLLLIQKKCTPSSHSAFWPHPWPQAH